MLTGGQAFLLRVNLPFEFMLWQVRLRLLVFRNSKKMAFTVSASLFTTWRTIVLGLTL